MKKNGVEISALNPGWIKKQIDNKHLNNDFMRIFVFFVINSPCTEISYSGKSLKEYGWKKNIWQKSELKTKLFSVARLIRDDSFVVAKKVTDMKKACEKGGVKGNFHKSRSIEKIIIYKSKENEFLSICYHIRNSLAHGRFAIYDDNNGEVYIMEDGIKSNNHFYVRSRMILKQSTLIEWINILEKGRLS